MAIVLDKVIIRDAGNTINISTNYSELNVKAGGLIDDLVANIEGNAATQEAYINSNVDTMTTQIASLIDPTGTGYTTEASDVRHTALSKATFEALARDNRDKFAGSGFVEWGNYAIGTTAINDGIWGVPSYVNHFFMGYEGAILGNTKTTMPYPNINGTIHKIDGTFYTAGRNKILLPEAPTVYPTGTTNHLITEGLAIAHADASNSGLILNGKFDSALGVEWSPASNANISATGGKLTVTSTDMAYAVAILNQTGLTIGREYTIEIEKSDNVSGLLYVGTELNSTAYGNTGVYTNSGRYSITFTAISTTFRLRVYTHLVGETTTWDNLALFPKDAISRADLTFLESWHEDTSEKGVLYDLGNVQYKGTISTGSAGTFAGSDTYSLFGNWQTAGDLVGNSINIATLTGTQLEAFVGNPENNCYYDGDKLIQVRYRVRTIAGLGDEWSNVDSQSTDYIRSLSNNGLERVRPQGKQVTPPPLGGGGTPAYSGHTNVDYEDGENGEYNLSYKSWNNSYTEIGTKVVALPIATIHRRNQGAYHPVFNANGTKGFFGRSGTSSWRLKWYNSAAKIPSSISNCFDFGTALIAGDISPFTVEGTVRTDGNIASTGSGRPDGLFYDQIAEGDITDLRNSAHDTNDMEVMNSVFNGAISGDERGTQSPTTSEVFQQTTSGTVATLEVKDGTMYTLGDAIQVFDMTTSTSIGRFNVTGISSNTLTVHTTFTKSANLYLIGGGTAQ